MGIVLVISGVFLGIGGGISTLGYQMAKKEDWIPGRLSPYGAMFWYSVGTVASNFLVVPFSLYLPLDGAAPSSLSVFFKEYVKAPFAAHGYSFGGPHLDDRFPGCEYIITGGRPVPA